MKPTLSPVHETSPDDRKIPAKIPAIEETSLADLADRILSATDRLYEKEKTDGREELGIGHQRQADHRGHAPARWYFAGQFARFEPSGRPSRQDH